MPALGKGAQRALTERAGAYRIKLLSDLGTHVAGGDAVMAAIELTLNRIQKQV